MSPNPAATEPQRPPTLVFLYGTTLASNKQWPLRPGALIIGKGRGCDLVLEAPDISAIHCVITRGDGGCCLRDCNSRSGVRVNGEKVKEHALRDGDVLQIGPFSFRVDAPAGGTAGGDRLQRRRRRLARLALTYRRRCRELRDRARAAPPAVPVARTVPADAGGEQGLRQQSADLDRRLREYEQRVARLDRAEQELARDRQLLDREKADVLQDVERREEEAARQLSAAEGQLARRREELDAEMKARRAALETLLEARRAEVEEELRRRAEEARAAKPPAPAERDERSLEDTHVLPPLGEDPGRALPGPAPGGPAVLAAPRGGDGAAAVAHPEAPRREEARRLELRRRELDALGRHLRRLSDRLREEQARLEDDRSNLTRGLLEAQMEQHEGTPTPEQWAQEHAEAQARLAEREAAVAKKESVVHAQRENVRGMLRELAQMQEQVRRQQDAEAAALREENAELRRLLEARHNSRGAEAPADEGARAARAELDHLRQINERLREALDQKDGQIEELRHKAAPPPADPGIDDVDSYEAELIQFRRQLEADRARLNEEIAQLRLRNQELDEATREMEMELSRERADMARERTRLERLREEIQADIERAQREGGIHNRLAPVQQLRQEMAEKAQAAPGPGRGENGRPR